MNRKRLLSILLAVVISISALSISCYATDSFESTLALFPDSYHASLTAIHNKYPNWTFKKISVGKDFSVAVNAEHNCPMQLCTVQNVSSTNSKACPSTCKYAKYHVSGSDRCASFNYIAECMDPTNYLTENQIFQFEYMNTKSYYTKANLETVLKAKSSFMYNKTYTVTVDKKTYSYDYSQIILDACKKNNTDALFIISRITKEVGALYPSSLAKGYSYKDGTKTVKVYNFFNIGGSVSGSAKYAFNKGWTNPKSALEGGIAFIANNYIKKGQYTNYLQKFQVNPNSTYGLYEHQYMQTVDAVIDESGFTFNSYSDLNYLSKAHTFYIPVYNNLSKVNYEAQDLRFRSLAESTSYAYVNSQVSSGLALRTQASTSSGSRIGYLASSTLLQVTSSKSGWLGVKVLNGTYKGKTGYVYGTYANFCQQLDIGIGTSSTLYPKLTTSTCSYGITYPTVSDCATVSSKGVVKGIKNGIMIVKATASSGSVGFVCIKVATPPTAPKPTAKCGTNSVTLSWNKVSSATQYRVYTYNETKKTYTHLATTTGSNYTVKSLKSGSAYVFLVRAFNMFGSGSVYSSANLLKVYTLPAKPSFTLSSGTNTVSIKWNKVTGADYYGVWTYNTSTKKYTYLKTVTSLSFSHTSLKSNTSYIYLVRSHNKSGWSAFTTANNKAIKTAPNKPSFKATASTNSVKISWSKVSGATSYRVYKYDSKSKKYTRLATTSGTSFTNSSLKSGTKYNYLVRAFNSSGKGSTYSSSNIVSVYTLPAKPSYSLSAESDSITIKWSKVSGAEYYGIWSYNNSTKKYTKIANTTNLSYTVSSLKSNTSYTYLLRSHNSSGWSSFTTANNKTIKTSDNQ